jgi:signal transduction histidine kinase
MQSRILRICRRIANYDIADRLLKIDDAFISKTDFNVQYELVYYFQSKNDFESLDKVLKEMQRSASSSVPIAKTLYNFYLSFDKFDEAQNLYERLRLLQEKHRSRGKSRQIEQAESEKFVWQRLKDLVSDQEHNRQMIAMRDLLKGFSHELGQPITNIRYGVQLQKLKMDKGLDTREELETLLNLILIQTSRIGHMLSRFRPIVSSKSESIVFNVKDCIEDVFEDLDTRLKGNNIAYTIKGADDIKLYGDPIQFSQVFYNLALNSMQAIEIKGKIYVDIGVRQGNLKIYFSDDGPGIPKENHHKIFEPFFSTKDPTSGNGGEGLGLFIVWNILKIFNGTIQIDKRYCKGAKFVITLPLLEEVKEK